MLTESISKLNHNHSFVVILIQNNMPRVHKIKLSQETPMRCLDFPFFPSFSYFLFVVVKHNSKTCFDELETKTYLRSD